MKTQLIAILLTLGSALFAQSQDSKQIVEFEISGGKKVKCAVTDSGPLPAESGPYKMEVAGMRLSRDEGAKDLLLIFTFNLKISSTVVPARIIIEDVSGVKAVTVIDDKSPKITEKHWSSEADSLVVSKATSPWLYNGKPTIKIYRVTISAKGSKTVILYQPSWYAVSTKQQIIGLAK